MRFLRLVMLAVFTLSACLNAYFMLLRPHEQMLVQQRLLSATHRSGPIIWLGDSILAVIEPDRPDVRNLSVSGASVDFVRTDILSTALSIRPSRVVVALGINDLRMGVGPEDVRDSLAGICEIILSSDSQVEIVLLAVLPLARSTELAGATDNAEIDRLNRLLKDLAHMPRLSFVDHSGMFRAEGGLADRLSFDGLHPNVPGKQRLQELLLSGIGG